MKNCYLILILILFYLSSIAQNDGEIKRNSIIYNPKYLGFDIGSTYNYLDFEDPYLYKVPLTNFTFGISTGIEIKEWVLFELGIAKIEYDAGYGIYTEQYTKTGRARFFAFSTFQIPLRIKFRYIFPAHRKRIFASFGYLQCYNSKYKEKQYGTYDIVYGQDSICSDHIIDDYNSKSFSLFEFSLGTEILIINKFSMVASVSYLIGNKNIMIMDLSYDINKTITNTTTFKSRGNYLALKLGLNIPFSELWKSRVSSKAKDL